MNDPIVGTALRIGGFSLVLRKDSKKDRQRGSYFFGAKVSDSRDLFGAKASDSRGEETGVGGFSLLFLRASEGGRQFLASEMPLLR